MRLAIILPALGLFAAPAAFAKSVAVGTCEPGLAELPTIQAAVNASTVGGTVEVCPGVYPEQVVINKSLTLKGVSPAISAPAAQAAIVVPAGGLQVTGTDPDGSVPTAAQITVTPGNMVNIENLTVDGANNNVTTCATDLVGIWYDGSSGTVSANWVKNQIQPAGYVGCQGGLAIYAETGGTTTATVVVSNNVVENYQKNGITASDAGMSMTANANTVVGIGATDLIAQNGIQVGPAGSATLTANTVSSDIYITPPGQMVYGSSGILVYDSSHVKVTGNNISTTQYAIAIYGDVAGTADYATISGNTVRATNLFDAVDICGASGATVSTNTLLGTDEAAIHLDSSCGTASSGDTLSGNTVNGACAAVLEGPGSSGSVANGKILNATTSLLMGSDVCPAAMAARFPQSQGGKRVHPFRR